MEFLGSLGIDVKLLIAQIINFGLLLWLLNKFLYKPIIKRIEKDETELKQARIQKTELEREKSAFAQQKQRERTQAKEKARAIIKEAESIAEEIKKETHAKAKKEASAMLAQAKRELQSQKLMIKNDALRDLKTKINHSFLLSFERAFPVSLQKELQNIFWVDLINRIKKLNLGKIKELSLANISEKTNSINEEGLIDTLVGQKIGPFSLEYVFPPTPSQEQELEKILSEKLGLKVKIGKKQNKTLVNGFRFEIAGTIIESNLLSIVNNAANTEQ